MGALPIALGLGAGSMSRRPLGYAIVGGVLFSTLLTLFLVPVGVRDLRRTAAARHAAGARRRRAGARAGGGRVMLRCCSRSRPRRSGRLVPAD